MYLEESSAEETRKTREEQQQREGQGSERHQQQQQPEETGERSVRFDEATAGKTRNEQEEERRGVVETGEQVERTDGYEVEKKKEEIREPARRMSFKSPLLDDNVRKRKAEVPEDSLQVETGASSSHVRDMEIVSDEEVMPDFSAEDLNRAQEKDDVFHKKRAAETSTEELESEIPATNVMMDSCELETSLRRADDCFASALKLDCDEVGRTPATSPEVMDFLVSAVRFSPDASEKEEFFLGGSKDIAVETFRSFV